jgi:twinkle protein
MTAAREQGAAWLEARGLDPELADKMGWEASFRKDGTVWLKIPYIRDGQPVTTQYRRLDAKEFRFVSGSEVELWNVDALKDASLANQPLILAEGACDGLALLQCGFARTVAVPGWSDKNLEPDRYEPFKRNEQAIRQARTVIVAQHADNAGSAMLRAVANFFDECDVRYVAWPKDCNDANDTLLLYGQEVVVQAVNGARQVDPPGGMITGFTDLPPRPERKIWRLDWPELDKFMAFRSREISLLTGTPGAGKSTFVTWAAHHLVRANDLRVGLCLFETDPVEVRNHLLRLHGCYGEFGEEGKRVEVLQALDRNYRVVHRVDEGEETHGMAWLKRMVHALAARDGCNLIVVDPWNELEHLPEPGESMTNYINFALMRMRQWADKYDVHICIVAHPKKMEPGRRPIGYDVADSAAFVNKPGMGWTIHLEDDEEHGEHVSLTCWKVRSRQETGCRPGRALLSFDEHSMTYRPIRRRVMQGEAA